MKRENIDIPHVVRFVGENPGPSLAILGGIHGNEPCGVRALEKLEAFLVSGELKVKSGSLTLIRGNIEALQVNKRFITQNLNRLFKKNNGLGPCYELLRAEQLKPLLRAADYILDIHSTSQPSPPFILCEEPDTEFARSLNIRWIVLGWAALDPSLDGDTCTWAARHGRKAVTLECGQHEDPSASGVAIAAAIRVLSCLGMIESPHRHFDGAAPTVLQLYHAHILRDGGFVYSRKYQGFDVVHAGECIGTDASGAYSAPQAGHIVLPADPGDIPLNSELYLLAHA
jgi:predicted deacylase